VNSYSYKNIKFPAMLNSLALKYSGINFKFLTSHPKDFSDELIDVIAKNKNISREIHLPVQAGSDKILKLMNRPYTQKKYLALIQKIKKKILKAGFTTDVIVGFPGETEKDFQKTVKVFKKVKYNEAYINKYSPRPGTAAWKLGDMISLEEKKRREKILRKMTRPHGKPKQ
jgi:tRNA-2-methylthio-N6-dimethylallyladenosine synthase